MSGSEGETLRYTASYQGILSGEIQLEIAGLSLYLHPAVQLLDGRQARRSTLGARRRGADLPRCLAASAHRLSHRGQQFPVLLALVGEVHQQGRVRQERAVERLFLRIIRPLLGDMDLTE